jgi:hypothetical protein
MGGDSTNRLAPALESLVGRDTDLAALRTLDGLPLAIGMAAARLPALGLRKTESLSFDVTAHVTAPGPAISRVSLGFARLVEVVHLLFDRRRSSGSKAIVGRLQLS